MSSPSVSCLYPRHLCTRDRLRGFDFCSLHILEDRNAPYKQCNYTWKQGRRCQKPAPKQDKKDGFCLEHSRQALVNRQRSGVKRPAAAVERGLDDLRQYQLPTKEGKTLQSEPVASTSSCSSPKQPKLEPEDAAEAKSRLYSALSTCLPSASQRALAVSDPESEGEQEKRVNGATVENAWRGDGDSDAESVDSDIEDPLKHAGAFTAEETIRIMRDKLIRLQKLYIEQFSRLQYLLKEERREFRINVRKEKEENFMSIHKQPKESPEEQIAYDTLKSLNHYSKPHGQEAILNNMLQEKRVRASAGVSSSSSSLADKAGKCTFNLTTNTKCCDTTVPMSKYCVKHIMSDPNQVLFRLCSVSTSDDGPCETPIPDLFDTSSCVYHTQLLPRVSDSKETIDLPMSLKKEGSTKQESLGEPPKLHVIPPGAK